MKDPWTFQKFPGAYENCFCPVSAISLSVSFSSALSSAFFFFVISVFLIDRRVRGERTRNADRRVSKKRRRTRRRTRLRFDTVRYSISTIGGHAPLALIAYAPCRAPRTRATQLVSSDRTSLPYRYAVSSRRATADSGNAASSAASIASVSYTHLTLPTILLV